MKHFYAVFYYRFLLILGLIGLLPNIAFSADRVIPCDGANCKIIFETKNGSNVKVQAAQIDGTGVMSFPSAGGGMVPAGTIIAFAGASTPAGYLPCDGAAVSQTTYAALYAALGSTWNTQRDKTTGSPFAAPGGGLFRVPDLRGAFLKGTGTPAAPYSSTALAATQDDKTAQNNMSASGGTASLSGSAAPSTHNHGLSSGYAGINIGGTGIIYQTRHANSFSLERASTTSIGLSTPGGSTSGTALFGSTDNYSGTNVTLSNTAASISSTDTDTVPINVGVNYFIKY